ncbi:MAG TPA: sugar-binding protein [Planctomycetota bacterium]|nr:sugar-binding protein [Planctomycetota bacterium]
MRDLFAAIFLAFLTTASFSGEPAPLDPKINRGVLPVRYGKLPLLWIPKLSDPAKVDGTLSDPVWKDAARLDFRDFISREVPKHATECYIFCSDTALYFGFRCHEPKLGELQVKEGEIWSRDSIEIFLEPYKDTIQKPYHHIMADAAGAFETARYHIYQRIRSMPRLGEVKWEPKMDVRTAKGENQWTMEIRLPFDQLVMSEDAKKKKTLWRMNIYRSRPQKGNEPHSGSAWAPPGVNMYHSAGKFGYVLPETMSTPEFIEEVRKTANPAPVEDKRVDPAEVDTKLGELGSENFDTRLAASTRLKHLADAGPKMFETVQQKLDALLKSTKVPETWAMAKDTLDDLKNTHARMTDDDPPPFGFE